MIFSRIPRSIARSTRSRFERIAPLGRSGASSALPNATIVESPSFQEIGRLGFLRRYLTSIGASKAPRTRNRLSNWNVLLANPSFRRLFSSGSPDKKNYENYYPKGEKAIPKGDANNKNKSNSKGL